MPKNLTSTRPTYPRASRYLEAVEELALSLDGLAFSALAEGPRGGPVVLLAHGFPDSRHTWRHLMGPLADAGYRAVALAMRGYAPSAIPPDVSSEPARLGLDLLGIGCQLSPEQPFTIIGHDWGAIASYAAAQINPRVLRSLVTLAVPPTPAVLHAMEHPLQLERSWYIFAFQAENYELEVQRDDFALIRRLWADWSPELEAPWEIEAAIDAIREPARTTAALNYYRALLDPTRRNPALVAANECLKNPLVVPTLYLHGRRDGCMGLDAIGDVAPWLPEGSKVELFESAGHFLHLEEPERVADLVLSFLADP